MAGELRAREVREKLKGRVDPHVSEVLENIAEQQFHIAKAVTQVVQIVDTLVDQYQDVIKIAGNLKDAHARLNPPEDDVGNTTQ